MASDHFDLGRIPFVKKMLLSRGMVWWATTVTLAFFILAILTGLVGTPAGSRNLSVVLVWIVWWALLILLLVPFGGRSWCAVCPIPAPGEWIQRRSLVQPARPGRLFTVGKKWPRRLNNPWLQTISFIAVALVAKVILTTPLATAVVLLILLGTSTVTSLLFERRAFCRYLCPVGGFIGLYSQVAPVEVRVKDPARCATHAVKSCYIGSDRGYGCPWLVYPATLAKNSNCGMCAECLKTCELDNVALNIRPFGRDLLSTRGWGFGEGYRALVILACAPLYTIVFMGPWSGIKEAAYSVGTPAWLAYAIGLVGLTLVLAPGLFLMCSLLSRAIARVKSPIRQVFSSYAVATIPLGLAAWVAFSLSFILTNISYAWPVISDPFGWGWNLFGTANWPWAPYLAGSQFVVQMPVLIAGLVGAVAVALRTAHEQRVSQIAALPTVLFCLVFTMGLVWLYV